MKKISIITLSLLTPMALAAELPRQVHVTYQVSLNGMAIGRGEDRFTHDGKTFSIVSETKTVGLAAALRKLQINREVHGLVTPKGLQSGTFKEERTRKPRKSVTFDWPKRQVTLESGDGPRTLPLPDFPTFDQSTFAWSFAFDPVKAKEGMVALTDGRKLSEYRYAVLGTEKITTPLGKLEAVHVKKIQEDGDKRGFEVWLGTQQFYLPVRILFTDDNSTIDSVISGLNLPTTK